MNFISESFQHQPSPHNKKSHNTDGFKKAGQSMQWYNRKNSVCVINSFYPVQY